MILFLAFIHFFSFSAAAMIMIRAMRMRAGLFAGYGKNVLMEGQKKPALGVREYE